tara:strand:+ start:235 stop:1146 length:912 start_codon:yes stop_codon:yes gene_type:complete
MLATFFSRSNPTQYILIIFLVIIYIVLKFNTSNFIINELIFTASLFITISYAITKFIISKNSLSKKNSYGLICLFVSICLMLEINFSYKIAISAFFLLLALRRMLSLRSPININKKVFDTSFWLLISSFFYPSTLIFFTLLIITLVLYAHLNLKNILIIIFSTISALSINYLASFLYSYNIDLNIFIESYLLDFNKINFTYYFDTKTNLLTLSFLLFLLLFFLSYIWSSFIKTNERRRSTSLIILISICSFLIIDPLKQTSYIFLLFPYVVLISKFFENSKQSIFDSLIITALLITPFLSLFL